MWGLLGWLLMKGQLALTNARWHTDFYAIYPEITHGNPLEAPHVIRYILNKPGVMSSYGVPGPITFDKSDEIYVFSKLYDTFGVDDNHILFLPILDLFTFKDQHKKRPNTCYFVGKGKDIGAHPKSAIKIHHDNQKNQQEMADVLNTCHTMYTYENPTAMNEVARLCGCNVVFIPQGNKFSYTKHELETLYEPSMMGIGWEEEVDFDVQLFRGHYKNLITIFETKLDLFINAHH